jgi:hypothetical protein
MRIANAIRVADAVVSPVRAPVWIVVYVGYRMPGVPPHGVQMPAPRRYPHGIIGAINILNRWPCPYIHDGMGCRGSGIRFHFLRRLNDRLNSIHIFVTYNLQHSFSICLFLELNDCDILKLGVGYHSLQHECVHVAFIPVQYPDIIDITIAIEVKIVDFRISRVQKLLEFLGRLRFFE